jgi:phosphatidate cytidylyltransferase
MSNLLQRIIVAVIGIPIVLFIVLTRPTAFMGLVVILACIASHEFFGLAKAKGYSPHIVIGIILCFLFTAVFGIYRFQIILQNFGISIPFSDPIIILLLLALIVVALLTIELFSSRRNPIENISTTVFGGLYPAIGVGSLLGIYEYFSLRNAGLDSFDRYPPGEFVVIILASIWISDSAAYFAGRAFGKHKLFERISPNKTWEGAAAGLLTALIIWLVAPNIFYHFKDISSLHLLVMGLIVGIIGPIGDLAESQLKRDAGVKDSSQIIPGHGGVLDRLDSLMFVSPTLLLYLHLTGLGS